MSNNLAGKKKHIHNEMFSGQLIWHDKLFKKITCMDIHLSMCSFYKVVFIL